MKNKNNIIIIFAVTLAAVAVIAVVLITGFFGGSDRGDSVVSVPVESGAESSTESDTVSSEPQSTVDSVVVSESSSAFSDNSASSEPEDDIGQKISASASALIGVPFVENGASPSGFDNSGFIYYVLQENGYITCPRTTLGQSQMGAHIDRDELKPGDLVFFSSSGNGESDFGGIYIGNDRMIACLSAGLSVREVDITGDYYKNNFSFGIGLS